MTAADPIAAPLSSLRRDENNQGAWRELIVLLWPFAAATVIKRCGYTDKSNLDDAVQSVFARLFSSGAVQRIHDAGEFRAYVWRISDNVARDLQATRQRKRYHEIGIGLENSELTETAIDPRADVGSQVEYSDLLHKLKRKLTIDEGELFEMLVKGVGLAEIASRSGKSYSSAGVRCHRLRKKLRGLVRENE